MIRLTERNIARNPVARAFAKQKLKQSMLDLRIRFMLMDDGEACESEVLTISDSIFVMSCCYEFLGQKDSIEFRKLRSAMNVLTECSESQFKWRKEWAVTIDNAIDICSENWTKIPSVTFQRAMKHILG